MKKILFFLFSATLLLCYSATTFAQSSEDSFFYGDSKTDPTTEFHTIIQDDIVEANDGVLKKILRVFKLEDYIKKSDASALEFIKEILNIALGLVSFIALVVVIYGFVKIIFAKDDEGITEARKTVQGAAIAIAIIAVSRFIVTFLFDLYGQFVKP